MVASHSAISPLASAVADPLAVDAVADQQPRAGRRREGNRGLQLRIIAAAGALIGVRPAAVEHVFALRVRFQIAGHDAGDRAVELGHEMPRAPAGARRRPSRKLRRRQKRRGKRRGYSAVLNSAQESPAAPDEASVSRSSRLSDPAVGLAQASHSAAGISLTEGTASRVISDDAIENLDRSHVAISHRAW